MVIGVSSIYIGGTFLQSEIPIGLICILWIFRNIVINVGNNAIGIDICEIACSGWKVSVIIYTRVVPAIVVGNGVIITTIAAVYTRFIISDAVIKSLQHIIIRIITVPVETIVCMTVNGIISHLAITIINPS